MEQPCRALRDAGVKSAIRVHDWSKLLGTVVNLVSIQQNRADAERIASEIAAYEAEHLNRPIDLLGYSGGAGMAVFVAEALPDGVRLRNVLLAQPALSPDYDLTPALRRIDGRLVNFYCASDVVLLGAGTSVLGTMDRRFEPSAGQGGFRLERAVSDEALRPRVDQRAWSLKTLRSGHVGGHFGILGYEWNRQHVAPLLTTAEAAIDRGYLPAWVSSHCTPSRIMP